MGENRAGRAVEVTVDAHAPDQCVFSNPTDSSLKHDVYSTPCIPPFLPILIYANVTGIEFVKLDFRFVGPNSRTCLHS